MSTMLEVVGLFSRAASPPVLIIKGTKLVAMNIKAYLQMYLYLKLAA